jgi:hypothetical protein
MIKLGQFRYEKIPHESGTYSLSFREKYLETTSLKWD